MIERMADTAHLQIEPGEILEAYRSINENMMSAEQYPTQTSEATVVGVRKANEVSIFVHYFLYEDNVGLLYQETDAVDQSNYVAYRDAALESVESMGFLLENLNLRKLDETKREELMSQLPVFGGHGKHVADYGSTEYASGDESVFLLDETVHELAEQPINAGTAGPDPAGVSLPVETWNIFMRFVASL